jgi:hypothetical protein
MMGDLVPEKTAFTPANVLAKQGVAAVGCLAGGAILLLIGAFPVWLSVTIGVLAAIVGLGAPLVSKDPEDKMPGKVLAAVGGCFVISNIPILGALASAALGLGTLGLFGLGIWKGIQFIKGLRARK